MDTNTIQARAVAVSDVLDLNWRQGADADLGQFGARLGLFHRLGVLPQLGLGAVVLFLGLPHTRRLALQCRKLRLGALGGIAQQLVRVCALLPTSSTQYHAPRPILANMACTWELIAGRRAHLLQPRQLGLQLTGALLLLLGYRSQAVGALGPRQGRGYRRRSVHAA